jgi:hypothetical protein
MLPEATSKRKSKRFIASIKVLYATLARAWEQSVFRGKSARQPVAACPVR